MQAAEISLTDLLRPPHKLAQMPNRMLVLATAMMLLLVPTKAQGGVSGEQGIEIEGARDRRGFLIGTGLAGGLAAFGQDVLGTFRLDALLGGGITERFTLGLNAHVDGYLGPGGGIGGGADIMATGFVWKGLYVRVGAGGLLLPRRAQSQRWAGAGGGSLGLGYEFFLNATAAMAVGVDYEVRLAHGDSLPIHGAQAGIRFTWY